MPARSSSPTRASGYPPGRRSSGASINEVVSGDELETIAGDLAKRFAAGPPGSYASIKRMINAAAYADFEQHLDPEAVEQQRRAESADFIEGVAAFTMKRPPSSPARERRRRRTRVRRRVIARSPARERESRTHSAVVDEGVGCAHEPREHPHRIRARVIPTTSRVKLDDVELTYAAARRGVSARVAGLLRRARRRLRATASGSCCPTSRTSRSLLRRSCAPAPSSCR